MLFGDKKNFGIEIKFEENKKYAQILLYITDIFIGRKDDVTYVESFFASLENRFENIKKLPEPFLDLEPEKIAKELFHNKYFTDIELPEIKNTDYDLLDECRIANLEDTFDVFDMMAYQDGNDNIIFCWELDFNYYNDKNYPRDIHCKKLDYNNIMKTIHEAVDYINKELGI